MPNTYNLNISDGKWELTVNNTVVLQNETKLMSKRLIEKKISENGYGVLLPLKDKRGNDTYSQTRESSIAAMDVFKTLIQNKFVK